MASTPSAARSSVDAQAAPFAARRSRSLSLLWLVLLANGWVLVIALPLLTFSPIEIDAPIKTLANRTDPMQSDELSLRVGQLGSTGTRSRLAVALRGAIEVVAPACGDPILDARRG